MPVLLLYHTEQTLVLVYNVHIVIQKNSCRHTASGVIVYISPRKSCVIAVLGLLSKQFCVFPILPIHPSGLDSNYNLLVQ